MDALPAGWSEQIDPASGKPYYVSPSGATSWERPAPAGVTPPPGMPPPPVKSGLPPGWTSSVDPSSGMTYYVNSATGTTQWEMPVGGVTTARM